MFFLAGTAFVLAHVLKVTIGFTFSCGLIDFLVFGVLQGNSKTHWVFIIVGGVMYFFLYYFSFRFLIKKFDLKTPGREDDNKLTIFNKKKMDYSFDQSLLDPQVQMIIKGLGGRYNFSDLDCCITRLRASLQDPSLVSEGFFKTSRGSCCFITGQCYSNHLWAKSFFFKNKD